MKLNLISWNVNGIRAGQKKGFLDWLQQMSPDILCVQETKAHEEQLDEALLNPPGYFVYWSKPSRKGYSGVATFTKRKPEQVSLGYGVEQFDSEGRVLLTEYPEFVLLNIYFPNGNASKERLEYKMAFYDETLRYAKQLKKQGKELIVVGDYNTAHQEIDLARPKENQKTSGFLPEERAWLDKWIENGQIDIFRKFNDQPEMYTWWDMKTRARERNVGWRIDYFFITPGLEPLVEDSKHLPEVLGSDHCPITLDMKF